VSALIAEYSPCKKSCSFLLAPTVEPRRWSHLWDGPHVAPLVLCKPARQLVIVEGVPTHQHQQHEAWCLRMRAVPWSVRGPRLHTLPGTTMRRPTHVSPFPAEATSCCCVVPAYWARWQDTKVQRVTDAQQASPSQRDRETPPRPPPPAFPPVVCRLQDALLVLAPQHALGQRQNLSLACRHAHKGR
jgi:hypothetical protein